MNFVFPTVQITSLWTLPVLRILYIIRTTSCVHRSHAHPIKRGGATIRKREEEMEGVARNMTTPERP